MNDTATIIVILVLIVLAETSYILNGMMNLLKAKTDYYEAMTKDIEQRLKPSK